MRRVRRVALGIAAGSVALVLVLALAGTFVARTTTGARWAFDRLDRWGITAERVEGRIGGPLTLHGARYSGGRVEVAVERLHVEWRPLALRRGRLELGRVEADGVRVRVIGADDSPPSQASRSDDALVPFPVELRRGRIRDLVVSVDANTFAARAVTLRGSANDAMLRLDTLELRSLGARGHEADVRAAGTITLPADDNPGAVDARLAWTGALRDGRRIAGSSTLTGDFAELRLRPRSTAPVEASAAATVRAPLGADMRWSAVLDLPRFELQSVEPSAPAAALAAQIHAAGDRDRTDARVSFETTHATIGKGTGRAALTYARHRLVVDSMQVTLPAAGARLQAFADVDLAAERPQGRLALSWRGLAWPLTSTADYASRAGTLTAEGTPDDFHARIEATVAGGPLPTGRWRVETDAGIRDGEVRSRLAFDAELADMPAFEGRARIAYAARRIDVDSITATIPSTGATLAARGRVRLPRTSTAESSAAQIVVDALRARLPSTGGRLDLSGFVEPGGTRPRGFLTGDWQDLGWPIADPDPTVHSAAGSLRIDARHDPARLAVTFDLDGAAIPSGRWHLSGTGEPADLTLDTIRGETLGGTVGGRGRIRHGERIRWDIDITATGLDPGVLHAAWPGDLGFDALATGAVGGSSPAHARIDVRRADGRLRDRAFTARLGAAVDGDRIRLDTLDVRSGAATISAAGEADSATVDVRFRVDGSPLEDLVPGATGTASGHGRLMGARARPRVTFTVEGRDLTTGARRLASLSADADVDLADDSTSVVAIRATGLETARLAVDSLRIDGRGTTRAHRIDVVLNAPDDRLALLLQGGATGGVWRGVVERLHLASAVAGQWQLAEPGGVDVARDSARMADLCWRGPGEICGGAAWTRSDGARWTVEGRAIPLSFLRPALPQRVEPTGTFRMASHGRVTSDGTPIGAFELVGDSGSFRIGTASGADGSIRFDRFGANVTSRADTLSAELDVRLDARSSLHGTATAVGTGTLGERALDARVTGELHDDGRVGRLHDSVTETGGRLAVDVSVGGRVREPDIRGRLAVHDGTGVIAPLGIRLRGLRIDARSETGRSWDIDGAVRSDTGVVTLAGTFDIPGADRSWGADLRLRGKAFEAYRTGFAHALVQPQLDIRATPDRIGITGEVQVPRARITGRAAEAPVEPSADVVILGADGTEEEESPGVTPGRVHASVRLVLGDDVSVDAFGLSGALAGALTLVAEPGRPPVGSGELRILDGRYRAYRQTFRIDQGRVIYANSPLDDPALDLRITRRSDSVSTGMDVSGFARAPQIALFSEPPMPDDEILAYLLIGRPLSRLGRAEGRVVRSAAESIGVAGGNLLLARLGMLFGFGEARIERREGSRGTAIVLGRRVLPRLHVNYSLGLLGASNVLRVRYIIGQGFVLQTESGDEFGADLFYTIER